MEQITTLEQFKELHNQMDAVYMNRRDAWVDEMKDDAFKYVRLDTIESIDRYVLHHIEPGSFLCAVLENNLMEAIGRADEFNVRNLRNICSFVYNCVPLTARFSVSNWLKLRHFKA